MGKLYMQYKNLANKLSQSFGKVRMHIDTPVFSLGSAGVIGSNWVELSWAGTDKAVYEHGGCILE